MSEPNDEIDLRRGRHVLNAAGFGIEANELANACRHLGITGPLEPLLRELKIKELSSSPSSQQQHQQSSSNHKESPRKVQQKREKRVPSRTRESPDCLADNYGDCNLQQKSSQQSWGRDSGARDLSPEPHRMHESLNADVVAQLMDCETGDDGGTSAMLNLASKLQVAALSALKTEVLELSTRLQHSERERELVQKKLNDAVEEKERSQRRLEAIGAAHESRITEMHCVIVELSKKLKAKQDSAILEEHEPDGSVSELSFQEGSVYNSEMECMNLDQQSQTEPLDIKLVQCDQRSDIDQCNSFNGHEKLAFDQQSDTHYSLANLNAAGGQLQMQAMHEEILYLRSHIALLQSKLASVQDGDADDSANVKVNLYENLRGASKPPRSAYSSDDLGETADIYATSHQENGPKQKSTEKCEATHETGSPANANEAHEIVSSKVNQRGTDATQTTCDQTTIADIPDSQLRNELHRMHRRLEHLRVQNNVLTISLSDCKAHCEHLYLLCGKYESNAIALSQALNCSDRTIEAYDVMLALLESKLGILENVDSAMESRRAAETVAAHLVARLDNETNHQNSSLGPWQDANVLCANSGTAEPWTEADDIKLRAKMSKLKGQRATVQNTVVALESPFELDVNAPPAVDCATADVSRKLELESAVLMQEMMSMREDLNEHKCRAEQAEQERISAHERLAVMQQALLHLQAQLADSEALLAMSNKDRSSYSEAEQTAGIELELVEALARESRLKARLQALAGSLEAATKSSEEKYAQVQNTVTELKQANLSLNQSLERCKRKYQNRMKRMEQQLVEMSMKQNSASCPGKTVPETTL